MLAITRVLPLKNLHWCLVGCYFQRFAFKFLVKCALVVGQVSVDPGLGNLAVEGRAL